MNMDTHSLKPVKAMLTVKTGKVKLENKLSATEVTTLAGEGVVDENDLAGLARKLQFQNTAMAEIVAVLHEYFLVPIVLDQSEMERIHFTGSFQGLTLKEITNVLQVALKAKVARESNGYSLVSNNML
jgi:ferric-dicitrate binding protein FerR (iron transport regulator)